MDEVKIKFLDTYALIEIAKGNTNFVEYLNLGFIITDINLAEFYSVLLREFNEKTADYWYRKIENYSQPVSKRILIEAVKFRHKNKKSGISFFDAVGYIFAVLNGYLFVTGDKEFRNLDNVEFRK